MTKQEAISQMRAGKKITHRYFTDEEWVKSDETGKIYIFEDGVELPAEEFWEYRTDASYETDWEIFQE